MGTQIARKKVKDKKTQRYVWNNWNIAIELLIASIPLYFSTLILPPTLPLSLESLIKPKNPKVQSENNWITFHLL